jgi:hypothetical protein
MDKNSPVHVSYNLLLLELVRRINCGWRTEDDEYLADLVFDLIANERRVGWSVRVQIEATSPSDSA